MIIKGHCALISTSAVRALGDVTLNSAYAIGVNYITAAITPGKRADLLLTRPGPKVYKNLWIPRIRGCIPASPDLFR